MTILLLQILGFGALWVIFGALIGRHENRQTQAAARRAYTKIPDATSSLKEASAAAI